MTKPLSPLTLSIRRDRAMTEVFQHCVEVAGTYDLCPLCLLTNLYRQTVVGFENGALHHSNHDKETEKETIQ